MSCFYCQGCDKNIDTDFIDFVEVGDELVCIDCAPPEALARKDFEMGGGLDSNPYDEDKDPLSDYQRYAWEIHWQQNKSFTIFLGELPNVA